MEVLCLVAVAKGGDAIRGTGAGAAREYLDRDSMATGAHASGKRTAEEAGHFVVRRAWVCLQNCTRQCEELHGGSERGDPCRCYA